MSRKLVNSPIAKIAHSSAYGQMSTEFANNLTTPLNLSKTGTAFDDPNYSPWDSVAHELVTGRNDEVKKATKETLAYIRARKDLLKKTKKSLSSERLLEANKELRAWLAQLSSARMQKIDSSKWTAFQEAVYSDNIFSSHSEPYQGVLDFIDDANPQIFLIQHEWAKLLRTASDEKGNKLDLNDFRLPFKRCIFEVHLDSRRMLILMDEDEADEIQFIVCIDCKDCWFVGERFSFRKFMIEYVQTYVDAHNVVPENYVLDNIAAMCICIEANVIDVEVTRAPHKLNASRAKQGKLPLPAYNTVSLNRRYRVINPTERSGDTGRKGTVRMHFRRGHWRHYETHKTWIKWMLVGNPDLGFVEHEYRA